MKLSIFEKNTIDETEVVVNCKQKNHEIEKLAKHILLYDGSIRCRKGDREYNIKINDIFYIENWTLSFDIKILFLTVFKGFVNKNAY